MKTSFYELTFTELEQVLKNNKLNPHGARLLYNWRYKKKALKYPVDLSKATLEYLEKNMSFELPRILSEKNIVQNNPQATHKFLVELADSKRVECVLIPFQGKYTLCVSSQVGCAMACSFCYTGTQGLSRHLKTNEIIGQLMACHNFLKEQELNLKITNIVFMGQGEPLHNFQAVKRACDILTSQYGLSIGREKITISTAGYLPGLKQWLESDLRVNLALSVHSADDKIRGQLIPLNKPYPLEKIFELLSVWPLTKKQFITIEYLLIDELTATVSQAQGLAKLLRDHRVLVNLIAFNPIPNNPYRRPDESAIEQFSQILSSHEIPTMIRKTKGDEILAACGQLNSKA